MGRKLEIASAYKVAYHQDKVKAYLNNDNIYPASLELDITSRCNRDCPDCPSSRGSKFWKLEMAFVERLFDLLSAKTKGLLMTGGEPTIAPTFPEVLKKARHHNFEEIAVVTNGSFLDNEKVADALLSYATTIRISIYDWNAKTCSGIEQILKKIEWMRDRIEQVGSKMLIGVSVLTSTEIVNSLSDIGEKIRSAGGHWIYFHPTCTKWNQGCPEQVEQSGVLDEVQKYQSRNTNGIKVFIFDQRYLSNELKFSRYHAASFHLVIGADGNNYLGAEVKYQPSHVLWNLLDNWHEDFLWHPERLKLISRVNSRNYPAIRSRHRGVLYSHCIESLITDKEKLPNMEFMFPHIL